MTRVIAVNPYDYWPVGGIRKSSLAARLVLTPSGVPVLGATIMRLRNRFLSDRMSRLRLYLMAIIFSHSTVRENCII